MTGAGMRVAVTREAGRNAKLAALLRARGAEPLEVPLIRFTPALTADGLRGVLRGPPGWLLLTSPQGARALAALMGAERLQRWQVAAVGEGTAQVLRGGGVSVAFVPERAEAAVLGATLPALPGERAVHLTSQRSHGTLKAVLEARGVGYERAELYRTEAAPLLPEQVQVLRTAHAVALASGSAAQALADAVGVHIPVAALGTQTAQVTRALGFTRLVEAAAPTLPALADAALQAGRIPAPVSPD